MLKLKRLLSPRWSFAPLFAGLIASLLAAHLNGCGQTRALWRGDKKVTERDGQRPDQVADSRPTTPPAADTASDQDGREGEDLGDDAAGDAPRSSAPGTWNAGDAPGAPGRRADSDRSLSRAAGFSSDYYQRDTRLADLFADREGRAGESMLCWPVALAYQTRYQAQVRAPRISQLSAILTTGNDVSYDVRSLAELCKTDRNDGTTRPKGARCIDELYQKAGLKASIEVIGVDAVWSSLGMYPGGTAASERAVALTDVIRALERDYSVIALIGFYQLSADGKTWSRYSGHFLSVTGYELRATDGGEQIDLHVVNPAVRYDAAPGSPKFDRIQMRPLGADAAIYPDKVAYEMAGNGISFTSYKTILESVVVFSAATP
jgi:hypothetical protein